MTGLNSRMFDYKQRIWIRDMLLLQSGGAALYVLLPGMIPELGRMLISWVTGNRAFYSFKTGITHVIFGNFIRGRWIEVLILSASISVTPSLLLIASLLLRKRARKQWLRLVPTTFWIPTLQCLFYASSFDPYIRSLSAIELFSVMLFAAPIWFALLLANLLPLLGGEQHQSNGEHTGKGERYMRQLEARMRG